jgi:alpha-tubulin suppressor-like RCC1 family protein
VSYKEIDGVKKTSESTKPEMELYELSPSTHYNIEIQAKNEIGLSIVTKKFNVFTMPDHFGSLYCWGSNAHAQLGFDDDERDDNYYDTCPDEKRKCLMKRPKKVKAMERHIHQISSGNVSTLLLWGNQNEQPL